MNTTTFLVNLGSAPVVAMGMTYTSSANSIALLMNNAVNNERLSKVLGNAVITQCLAQVVAAGAVGAVKGK